MASTSLTVHLVHLVFFAHSRHMCTQRALCIDMHADCNACIHQSSNSKLNRTFVAHRASIALIATEPFHICISSAMPLRGVDGYVYAYIVLAVSASDVQVFLFLGDFSLDDIARHFAKLVHNERPTVLPGAGDRCMYWNGSESYLHCVCSVWFYFYTRVVQVSDQVFATAIQFKMKKFKRIVGLQGLFGFSCAQSLNFVSLFYVL